MDIKPCPYRCPLRPRKRTLASRRRDVRFVPKPDVAALRRNYLHSSGSHRDIFCERTGHGGTRTRRENPMEVGHDKILASRVEGLIQAVTDFPLPNIRFRDITPIIESDPHLFRAIIDGMAEMHRAHPPDCIVCIEAWGYVFGIPMAYLLGSRICLARRPASYHGKL